MGGANGSHRNDFQDKLFHFWGPEKHPHQLQHIEIPNLKSLTESTDIDPGNNPIIHHHRPSN